MLSEIEAARKARAEKVERYEKMLHEVFLLRKNYFDTHKRYPTHVLLHTSLRWDAMLINLGKPIDNIMDMQVIEVANMDRDFLQVIELPTTVTS